MLIVRDESCKQETSSSPKPCLLAANRQLREPHMILISDMNVIKCCSPFPGLPIRFRLSFKPSKVLGYSSTIQKAIQYLVRISRVFDWAPAQSGSNDLRGTKSPTVLVLSYYSTWIGLVLFIIPSHLQISRAGNRHMHVAIGTCRVVPRNSRHTQ
jgi:hypothetical protein